MTSNWWPVLLALCGIVLCMAFFSWLFEARPRVPFGPPRHRRVEPPVAAPVLRYPRLGETYIDRRPNALAMVHRCTHPEYHGPRLCEPEWHEIVPEEAEHHG